MHKQHSRSLLAITLFSAVFGNTEAASESMQAVQYSAWGDSSVMHIVDVPRPRPRTGEVLVKVEASGVNSIDWENRRFGPLPAFAHAFPVTPGYDLAGTIVALGAGVSDHYVGERIFAMLPLNAPRAYAEFVNVPGHVLATVPDNVDAIHAAAMPMAALTAWQALFDAGKLKAGQTVLIHGAAGGVAHIAVQLAKQAGAKVIGTASEANLAFVLGLGADQAIDYRAQRFEDVVKDVDLVFDTVGDDTLQRSYQVIRPGGTLVTIAGRVDAAAANQQGIHAVGILVHPDAVELAQVAALMAKGAIHAEIDAVYSLSEAALAQDKSEGRHVHGRLVLRVGGVESLGASKQPDAP
jgi:NADPH:quinone reductase-like Zn-dependent oxidoreductase